MVQHPCTECRTAQEQILFDFSPNEKERRNHELLFSYGNAAYRYHQEAAGMGNESLWEEWLSVIPPAMREEFGGRSYHQGRKALPFTRYVMERNDIGMEAYIKNLMGEEDYAEYKVKLNLIDPENTLEL